MEDSTNVVAIWVGFLLPIQAVRAVLGGFLDTCDSSVGETAEFCLDFVHVEDIVIDFYCSKCHEETCGISFVSIHLGCICMYVCIYVYTMLMIVYVSPLFFPVYYPRHL